MATYAYTGVLADFSEQPIPGAIPELWVTAGATFGPTGPIPNKSVKITVGGGGAFTVNLVASVDTSPEVTYMLHCRWIAADDPERNPVGYSTWEFTAAIGGGPIKDMVSAPASTWFVGPPWPAEPVIGAFYVDRTGDQPWARYTG